MVRFIERPGASTGAALPLPGLTGVTAAFDGSTVPAYADHWVRKGNYTRAEGCVRLGGQSSGLWMSNNVVVVGLVVQREAILWFWR